MSLEDKKAAAKRLIELSRTGMENRTSAEDDELRSLHLNHAAQLAEDFINLLQANENLRLENAKYMACIAETTRQLDDAEVRNVILEARIVSLEAKVGV